MKISIIGAGKVGASAAFCILERGLADELCLVDVDANKARGVAIDLSHGVSEQGRAATVMGGGDYSIAQGSDIYIITAGSHRMPGQSRLDLTKTNAGVVREVMVEISGWENNGESSGLIVGPKILVVTNPVDVMTYVAVKTDFFPERLVFGLGTVLDSIRFKTGICTKTGANPETVEAMIVGEHGDSMVPLLSLTRIDGKPVSELDVDVDGILEEVRTSADEIVKYKGGTCYAPAVAIANVVEAVVRDEKRILPVSTFHEDYGVCVSLPVQVGSGGFKRVMKTRLSGKEKERFEESLDVIRKACAETGL